MLTSGRFAVVLFKLMRVLGAGLFVSSEFYSGFWRGFFALVLVGVLSFPVDRFFPRGPE